MVKHLTVALDDDQYEKLTKLKGKKGLTWNDVLQDWLRRVQNE